jgi:hypothetical protein
LVAIISTLSQLGQFGMIFFFLEAFLFQVFICGAGVYFSTRSPGTAEAVPAGGAADVPPLREALSLLPVSRAA